MCFNSKNKRKPNEILRVNPKKSKLNNISNEQIENDHADSMVEDLQGIIIIF